MPDPIALPDGKQITSYDASTIEVSTPGGKTMRTARAAAPQEWRSLVDAAESQSAVKPRSMLSAIGDSIAEIAAPTAAALAAASTTPTPSLREQGFAGTVGPDAMRSPASAVAAPAGPAALPTPAAPPPPSAPMAPASPEPAQQVDTGASPLAAAQAELANLRLQPQTTTGGTQTRTSTQTTSLPSAAIEKIDTQQGAVDAAVGSQKAALDSQGGAEEKAAAAQAKVYDEQGRQIEQHYDQAEVDAHERDQRVTAETKKWNDLSAAAKTEIDPGRWWKSKSTGEKILAGLAAAAGGFAQGYSGGRVGNPALEAIQAAIGRDVDAQLENRKGAENAADRQSGMVDRVRQQYSDKAQQREALMLLGNERAAAQARGIAATLQSETARARLLQTAAELDQHNAERVQNLVLQTAGSITKNVSTAPGGTTQTAAGAAADQLEKALYVDFNPRAYVPGAESIFGVPMQAIDEADAKDLNTTVSEAAGIRRDLGTLKGLKGKVMSSAAKALAEGATARIAGSLNRLNKGGALDAGAVTLAKEQLGRDPTAWYRPEGNTVLVNLEQAIVSDLRNKLRNRAVEVNPSRVPATMQARYAASGGGGNAAPQTQPLEETQ